MRYLEKDGIVWQLTERKYRQFLADALLDEHKDLDDYGRKICSNIESVSRMWRKETAREKESVVPKSHPFTIRLNATQYAAVRRLSLRLAISVSDILRLALARFVEEENRRSEETHSNPH